MYELRWGASPALSWSIKKPKPKHTPPKVWNGEFLYGVVYLYVEMSSGGLINCSCDRTPSCSKIPFFTADGCSLHHHFSLVLWSFLTALLAKALNLSPSPKFLWKGVGIGCWIALYADLLSPEWPAHFSLHRDSKMPWAVNQSSTYLHPLTSKSCAFVAGIKAGVELQKKWGTHGTFIFINSSS